jgi:hypothetical protein
MSDAAIDLADIRFSWPSGRCVLTIRRLTIQPGERVFLHGRSGTYCLLFAGQPILEKRFGIFVQIHGLSGWEWAVLAAIIASALVMSLLPAFRAYRNTLSDGLQMRV